MSEKEGNNYRKYEIMNALRDEYLREVFAKNKKKIKTALSSETLGFADLTVWFYKRNCPQSLEEAKNIWEQLPKTPIERHSLNDFLDLYSAEIIDKHKKFSHYQGKFRKLEKILYSTQVMIQSLQESFLDLGIKPTDLGKTSNDENGNSLLQDITRFSIYIDSVQNHNLDSLFEKSEFIGHQIEIGHKDNIVCTHIEQTNGNAIIFNKNVEYSFSLFDGSVYIYLYENYLIDGEEQRILVAKRNLDLFSNVNKQFLYDILEVDNVTSDKKEIKYDIFYLKKIEKEEDEDDIEDERLHKILKKEAIIKDKYAKLKMSIHMERYLDKEDLILYFKLLKKRKAHLEEKMKKIKFRVAGYKQKVTLMILPFNNVLKFDDKSIIFSQEEKGSSNNNRCNIF